MPKHYYSMTQPEQGGPVELYIYGDILCEEDEPTPPGSVSSHRLATALEGLNASAVTVYINSYGGHTSEGLAIYHALRRLECPITTVCDGFACSAASLVFMAGDRRVMQQASLLMIHNAWLPACGNAAQLRKVAEDLDKISAAGRAIYRAAVTISDEELDALLDNESWIAPAEAVAMGFATEVADVAPKSLPSQSCGRLVFQRLLDGATVPIHVAVCQQEQKTEADPDFGAAVEQFVTSAFQALGK